MSETIEQRLERLRSLLKESKISPLQEARLLWLEAPDWLKSVLVRSLIGFVVMWFVTHLAVYHYALKFGMQLPLEGVPFLVVVSLIASAVISVFSAANVGLQAISGNIISLEKSVETANIKKPRNDIRVLFELLFPSWFRRLKLLLERSPVLVIVLIVMYGMMMALGLVFTTQFFISYMRFIGISGGYSTLVAAIISVVLTVVFLFVISRPFSREIGISFVGVGNSVYAVGLVLVGWFLTFGGGTDRILAATKFGGGIDVNLDTDQGIYSEASLMIQTNSTIVIWDRQTKNFVWVPLESVNNMEFASDPKIILPPSRPLAKRFGFGPVD